ncbi:hypothetical protein [Sphingobium sp. CAP-1]|uniref:hypothetical protein n=1 Tax=Sphingobium sp. CAP-1 TaxID=2676077 RepID=UPI001E3FE99A|nr:hypothetical protein [Sphingobium sp. CAP-1]
MIAAASDKQQRPAQSTTISDRWRADLSRPSSDRARGTDDPAQKQDAGSDHQPDDTARAPRQRQAADMKKQFF